MSPVVVLVVLQAADLFTTRMALAAGFVERNPFMAGIVENVLLFAAVKILVVVFVALGMRAVPQGKPRIIVWAAVLLVSAVPVISNTVLLCV